MRHGKSSYRADYETDDSSEQTENDRLCQKLEKNRGGLGSQCFSYSYLPCAFGDGDKHNIHNTYTADHQ